MAMNLPNFCACGHTIELHTPLCSQCPTPHNFNPEAVVVVNPTLSGDEV